MVHNLLGALWAIVLNGCGWTDWICRWSFRGADKALSVLQAVGIYLALRLSRFAVPGIHEADPGAVAGHQG